MYAKMRGSRLHQLVEQPKRGDNILDHVLTTKENIVTNVEVGPEFSNSDYRAITFTIEIDKFSV